MGSKKDSSGAKNYTYFSIIDIPNIYIIIYYNI